MVTITTDATTAHFEIVGLDKLWALRSRLEVPLAHIRDVRVHPDEAHNWWKGLRIPGTQIPGVVTAGTFYWSGEWAFWDVHHPDRTIIVELENEHYAKLIVEVEDPDAAVRELLAARDRATAEHRPS